MTEKLLTGTLSLNTTNQLQNQENDLCAQRKISLGIRPVWSEPLLSAWRSIGSLATHKAHSKGSDQTGRMPRLIGSLAGCTDHFVCFVMWWLIATHKAHSEGSDQTGRMPRLIWNLAGCTDHFVCFVMCRLIRERDNHQVGSSSEE